MRHFLRYLAKAAAFALLFAGCSYKEASSYMPKNLDLDLVRQKIILSTQGVTGRKDLGECSGVVSIVNEKETGLYNSTNALEACANKLSSTETIYGLLKKESGIYRRKAPTAADLVFFSNINAKKNELKIEENSSKVSVLRQPEQNGTVVIMPNLDIIILPVDIVFPKSQPRGKNTSESANEHNDSNKK